MTKNLPEHTPKTNGEEGELRNIIGAAFMCGVEQTAGYVPKDEMAHRIEAFEHSKGYKELCEKQKQLIAAEKRRAVEEARVAGARAYKDTLQTEMAANYDNTVSMKDMDSWYEPWKANQLQSNNQEEKE